MAYTTINDPTDYFNTKLYAGNSGTQSITGVNFQPDFLWIKRRNIAGDHNLVDVIRTSDKTLMSNSTDAEYSNSTITSFDSDGFSLSGSDGALNASGSNYVAWNWLANGAGSANTAGSINSTVSVSATSGFSIVSYTGTGSAGATIGHGLGVAPNVIITKSRTASNRYWGVYHSSLGNTGSMALNSNQAFDTSTTYWNDTTPSSTLFTVGTNGDTNSSGTMIAYCFAQKQGYSKFGSYTGNANTDGAFVYCGFRPAFVMIKSTALNSWEILDNKRNPSNVAGKSIFPDGSGAEYDYTNRIDILSNGFKARTTSDGVNGSGINYMYMAFAEFPFTSSTGTPVTAR